MQARPHRLFQAKRAQIIQRRAETLLTAGQAAQARTQTLQAKIITRRLPQLPFQSQKQLPQLLQRNLQARQTQPA